MLSLESPRWRELAQAYGSAEDVPRLLEALVETPDEERRAPVWFVLWRMLHQEGTVYAASYACVPHLVQYGAAGDVNELARALHLVATIEMDRRQPGSAPMPEDLVAGYAAAIEQLPALVVSVMAESWTSDVARILAAALLVGKRQPALARILLDGDVEQG